MAEITLSDALSLVHGAKKAMAEGYESRYMPYMAMAAAKLADDLAVWKPRAEAAENVLQNLMSFLSVNGCRTEIDPANAELRIRDGISMLIKPAPIRAEIAEEELASANEQLRKAREQEPVAWYRPISSGGFEGPMMDSDSRMCDVRRRVWTPLYAAQKPAVPLVDDATAQRIALAVYDYQNRISDEPLMHVINRILAKEAHSITPKPVAPAVPEEWREVINDAIEVLAHNNWRGDLQEQLRELLGDKP